MRPAAGQCAGAARVLVLGAATRGSGWLLPEGSDPKVGGSVPSGSPRALMPHDLHLYLVPGRSHPAGPCPGSRPSTALPSPWPPTWRPVGLLVLHPSREGHLATGGLCARPVTTCVGAGPHHRTHPPARPSAMGVHSVSGPRVSPTHGQCTSVLPHLLCINFILLLRRVSPRGLC